jgi:Rrf2 family protein
MLLSQTAEYALRAMAHLAAAPSDAAVPSADLAEYTGIPPHYISKVLRRLVVAGLCDAKRGHHGGFRLARPADEITFADVIAAAEPDQGPIGCAFGYGRCDLENPCPLHESWSALKREFATWSETTTLDQVREYAERPEVSFRRTPRPQ